MKAVPGIQPYVAPTGPGLTFAAARPGPGQARVVAGGSGAGLPRPLSIDGGILEQAVDQVIGAMEASGSAQGGFRQAAPGLIGGCFGFGYQVVKLTGAIRDRDAAGAWRAGLGALAHSLQFTAHTFGAAHPGAHALLIGVAENAELALDQLPPSGGKRT